MQNTDVVIIGGGPVGVFAIFEAGMLDMSCHLVESQKAIGGQCKYLYPEKPIYDIPGYPKISAEGLIDKLKEQSERFNPFYHLGRTAVRVEKKAENDFDVTLDNGHVIACKAVIISGGCGAFEPNKPMVRNLTDFEGENVHYMVSSRADFDGKDIVIAGGGDSAVDWAISLADVARKIYVVHRRAKFRCHPQSQEELYKLSETDKVEMLIPYQLSSLEGKEGRLESVLVKEVGCDNTKSIDADELLIFFGLRNDLGPIIDWGLSIENKRVLVNQRNCMSNISGIYAIGDVASYEGKLKLILTGFAEAAAACHDIRQSIFADTAFNFEYSTNKVF